MSKTINFGIDLGTTNSAIAKFANGDVVIYSNPQDYGRMTLPSVIAFRKDKTFVGNKAKEFLEKDPLSVVGSFKRKMGTTSVFKIKSLGDAKSPVELSSIILKELKNFLPSNEHLDAAVITIPASFDTIQSNATKEAGFKAGLQQVVLLQEPIAASLAYANKQKKVNLENSRWIVYDFGGGTFDVALIQIENGEMKIVDHEGDNYLGGTDIDNLIVENIIFDAIKKEYTFEDLEKSMKTSTGRLNSKYYILLKRCEEAKILLSNKVSADVLVDGFSDDSGNEVDFEITITRSELNNIIKDKIDYTIKMINKMLVRNNYVNSDIDFIIMVGGTTFIPYVKQRVNESLNIQVLDDIDPTTAVAVGAAIYAGTKVKDIAGKNIKQNNQNISVKYSYNKASKDKEELFSVKFEGNISNLYYRILREDNGFDSGIKKVESIISEELPLVDGRFNFFTLKLYDNENNLINFDAEPIGINSGYAIGGQPLPDDISIEIDDIENPGKTKLHPIFFKNSILPIQSAAFTFPLTKTLQKGNRNDSIKINIVEGPYTSLPEANKNIGFMEITGEQLSRDVSRGSDIELKFAMSESRDLNINVFLTMSDQEFKQTFTPKNRNTDVNNLKEQISFITELYNEELENSVDREDYETSEQLNKLKKEVKDINNEINNLTTDDVTDKKYQLEDKKRALAQKLDAITKKKKLFEILNEYNETKIECMDLLDKYGNDSEHRQFDVISSQEPSFLNSGIPSKIKEKIEELDLIIHKIRWRSPEFLVALFEYCKENAVKLNDQSKSKILFDAGIQAISEQNWDKLRDIDTNLLQLLPTRNRNEITNKIGFGLT